MWMKKNKTKQKTNRINKDGEKKEKILFMNLNHVKKKNLLKALSMSRVYISVGF